MSTTGAPSSPLIAGPNVVLRTYRPRGKIPARAILHPVRPRRSAMSTVGIEPQQLLIGGEWTPASGGGTFERIDPFTGEPVTVAAAAGREDARRACEAAAAAVAEWSQT